MNIRGIYKTSLIDFPGKISSVLFTGGCNLRCGYCHNPKLACNSCDLMHYSNDEALGILQKRRGLIEAVTISGGEPTIAKNILQFIGRLKGMGLSIKIDTNGLNPQVIRALVDEAMVDYVAIDVKTSPEKYESLSGKKIDFSKIFETIDCVRTSGMEYEIRTTCLPRFVTLDDFASIRSAIGLVNRYYLQQFVNTVTLDDSFNRIQPYPLETLLEFKNFVSAFARICEIRGM